MSRALPLFAYARELRRVPPGLTAHPGLRSFELPAVARRLGSLADELQALFPQTAVQIRTVAAKLIAQYGACGLTGSDCVELSTWLAMVGGHITILEPEAERSAEAGAA
ncbi:MAG TPA: hypothetical protein VD978_33545 [Azospirillum sp.]|nr:hypothetical protein [Azospirillum sp.]